LLARKGQVFEGPTLTPHEFVPLPIGIVEVLVENKDVGREAGPEIHIGSCYDVFLKTAVMTEVSFPKPSNNMSSKKKAVIAIVDINPPRKSRTGSNTAFPIRANQPALSENRLCIVHIQCVGPG